MKEITIEEFNENPFKLIGKDWLLITAQKDDKVNTMTASWGGTGVIWNKNVVTVYIRNSRYTKEFVDGEDRFSLCVLPETYRKELAYCGKVSGRDEDKIAKCGFTVEHKNGVPFFKESRLVINCKKLYAQQMQADCFTKEGKNLPQTFYADNDWHIMYIAEIESIFVA
ncbi:flavin reductase family protein [Treponema sp.]|uniref:flavin reductase family protein n=1 Tax=Treponema sp. TaxID=166 RepID=UPI003F0D23A9